MDQLHDDTNLERALVAAVRLQLVLLGNCRLANRKELRFTQLGDGTAVLLSLNSTPDQILAMTEAAGVTPNIRWRFRTFESIRSVVGRGMGYTVIMRRTSGDETYDGHKLVYKRIVPPARTLSTWVCAASPMYLRLSPAPGARPLA